MKSLRLISCAIVGSLMAMLAMLSLTGCGSNEQAAPRVQRVRLQEVSSAGGILHYAYPGRTKSVAQSEVAFKVAGTLKSIPVKVGSAVRKGQVIAQLDDHDYQVQLKATRAEYESTKAECERIIALYQDNGTSENNYDKARYGLEQITQKLQHAEDQVNNCKITAPFDGYVATIYHEQGETVGAGMAVISVFASHQMEVIINVPAADYQRRNLVDKFTATFAAIPGEVFPLTLANVAARANVNQLYEVHLQFDRDVTQITPGMTAMVDLQLKPIEYFSIHIPAGAVFADAEGTSYVYVYDDASHQIHKRKVSVMSLNPEGDAVIGDGLNQGEKIVSSGVHHLTDGETVEPNPEPTETNVGGLL